MGQKVEGIVKWFSQVRGYGFIESVTPHQFENGDSVVDYWVHYTNIDSDKKFKKLKQNQKVTFIPAKNDKGYFADHVTVVEEA